MFSQSHRLTQKFLTNLSSFTILLFSFLVINCAGNFEKELEELDKIYGYCDNPQRNIRGAKYTICKDKERAAGPSGSVGEKSQTDEWPDQEQAKLYSTLTGRRDSEEEQRMGWWYRQPESQTKGRCH